MPRVARKQSATDIYHVCNRGHQRQQIFYDDKDRKKFLSYVEKALEDSEGTLLAWCLMDNHYHFIAQMPLSDLARFIHYVSSSYAMYFKKKYQRSGHLFQNRYKSQPIETNDYLITAIRYVHQNPEKAKICSTNRYRWSSYAEYVGKPKLIDTELVLSTYESKKAFIDHHKEMVTDRSLFDVDNGWKMTDAEAYAVACDVLGKDGLRSLKFKCRESRDVGIRKLLAAGIYGTAISRLTGISTRIIYATDHK